MLDVAVAAVAATAETVETAETAWTEARVMATAAAAVAAAVTAHLVALVRLDQVRMPAAAAAEEDTEAPVWMQTDTTEAAEEDTAQGTMEPEAQTG